MEITDMFDIILTKLNEIQLEQLAFLAVVTLVTAFVVYVLVDAARYKAIPVLNVAILPGRCRP